MDEDLIRVELITDCGYLIDTGVVVCTPGNRATYLGVNEETGQRKEFTKDEVQKILNKIAKEDKR